MNDFEIGLDNAKNVVTRDLCQALENAAEMGTEELSRAKAELLAVCNNLLSETKQTEA